MKIIDISPENESHYFCCLEEWSEDIKDAGNYKQEWFEKMKEMGARVKFALDDNNVIGGMIQYIPIEESMFEGENLYVVLCIWVHGHKEGKGNHQKKGMGKALLKAAEDDCREIGVNGLVTWGLAIPVFMKASWYKRHGYKVVDKNGMMRLLWKPFNEKAVPPRFIKPIKKPEKGTDKVNITIFRNGWCPAQNMAFERAKRTIAEFPGQIELKEYDTLNKEIFKEWGQSDGLFIEGKEVRTGPTPSYLKIKKKIAKKVRKKTNSINYLK